MYSKEAQNVAINYDLQIKSLSLFELLVLLLCNATMTPELP